MWLNRGWMAGRNMDTAKTSPSKAPKNQNKIFKVQNHSCSYFNSIACIEGTEIK